MNDTPERRAWLDSLKAGDVVCLRRPGWKDRRAVVIACHSDFLFVKEDAPYTAMCRRSDGYRIDQKALIEEPPYIAPLDDGDEREWGGRE